MFPAVLASTPGGRCAARPGRFRLLLDQAHARVGIGRTEDAAGGIGVPQDRLEVVERSVAEDAQRERTRRAGAIEQGATGTRPPPGGPREGAESAGARPRRASPPRGRAIASHHRPRRRRARAPRLRAREQENRAPAFCRPQEPGSRSGSPARAWDGRHEPPPGGPEARSGRWSQAMPPQEQKAGREHARAYERIGHGGAREDADRRARSQDRDHDDQPRGPRRGDERRPMAASTSAAVKAAWATARGQKAPIRVGSQAAKPYTGERTAR